MKLRYTTSGLVTYSLPLIITINPLVLPFLNFAPIFEVDPAPVSLSFDDKGTQVIKLPTILDGNVNDTFVVTYKNLPKFVISENN